MICITKRHDKKSGHDFYAVHIDKVFVGSFWTLPQAKGWAERLVALSGTPLWSAPIIPLSRFREST